MLNAKENSLYPLINATILMPNMKTLIPIQVDNIYIYMSQMRFIGCIHKQVVIGIRLLLLTIVRLPYWI